MANNSILADQYEKQIESLLAVLDSSSSGDEEASDLIGSGILSKYKEKANRLDRWRLLEVEIKLLKNHYLTIVREKNVIIEEKNIIIEEKNRIIEEKSCFMDEKMRIIEKNHMLEEKCRILEAKESETRNELLKHQLEEANKQNKMLTEERDQLKQEQEQDKKLIEEKDQSLKEQIENQKRLEKELSEVKEKVKLINKKDDQIKKLKQQAGDKIQQILPSTEYPKKVLVISNNGFLGVLIRELPGGGVYVSSLIPDSPAARAGVLDGERLLEFGNFQLYRAGIGVVKKARRHCRAYLTPNIHLLLDAPVDVDFMNRQESLGQPRKLLL